MATASLSALHHPACPDSCSWTTHAWQALCVAVLLAHSGAHVLLPTAGGGGGKELLRVELFVDAHSTSAQMHSPCRGLQK